MCGQLFSNQPDAAGPLTNGFDLPFAGTKAGKLQRGQGFAQPVIARLPAHRVLGLSEQIGYEHPFRPQWHVSRGPLGDPS